MHFYESVLDAPVHILHHAYEDYITVLNEIDPAHNESHIMHTCMNAQRLIKETEERNGKAFTVSEKLIIKLACYLHDIGNIEDRDTHHEIGSENIYRIFDLNNYTVNYSSYLANYIHPLGSEVISPENLSETTKEEYKNIVSNIASAVLKHRASYKGERNGLEEIVAMADRGAPNLEVYLYRSYVYGRTKMGLSINDSIGHSFLHILVEKFGEEGYGFADGLIEKYYPNEYRAFCERRDSLTVKEYKNMVYSLNWENKVNDKRSER